MEIQFSVKEAKNVVSFKNVICMILFADYLKNWIGNLYLTGVLLYLTGVLLYFFFLFSSILMLLSFVVCYMVLWKKCNFAQGMAIYCFLAQLLLIFYTLNYTLKSSLKFCY